MNRKTALLCVGVVAGALVGTGRARAAPTATRPAQESLVELIPARARAAAIVRRHAIAPLRDLVTGNVEMMKELVPYLERTLGIDLTRLEALVFFTTDVSQADKHLGLLLRIPAPMAALKLPVAGDAGGTALHRLERDLFCARTKAGLALGSEAEVRLAVAVERGREPALPRDAGLGRLLASDAAEVDLVVAVGPGSLPPDKAMGVEDGVLTFRRSGSVELVLHGEPTQLQSLRAMAVGAAQMGLAALQVEKDRATGTNDPWKGSAAIFAYHQARKLAAELEPTVEGNALKVRYALPDVTALNGPTTTMALVGVAAAVGIPSFVTYLRRARTAEARTHLRQLATRARALASEDPKKARALKGTDWTPRGACCGQPANQCAPDAAAWRAPTWKALGFSIDGAHRFQYRVRVEGKGAEQRLVFEARADLDCDGQFSSLRHPVTLAGPDGGDVLVVENEGE